MTKVRAQVNEETSKGQLPWGHTNLIGTVYLNPVAGGSAIEASNTPAVAPGPASEVELEFWRSIKDSNKPEELNAYLTNYPNGTFKSLALTRIAKLQDGPSTATRNLTSGSGIDPATFTEEANQITEDQLGLDRSQRRDVQRRLTGLGFDIKSSGKFDEATRTVITRWQAARGYPKTGYLNALQHKALQSEILATRVASHPATTRRRASHSSRRRGGGGGGRHYHRGGGGPGGLLRRHDGRTVPPLSSEARTVNGKGGPRGPPFRLPQSRLMPSRQRRPVDNKSARWTSQDCSRRKSEQETFQNSETGGVGVSISKAPA